MYLGMLQYTTMISYIGFIPTTAYIYNIIHVRLYIYIYYRV